MQVRRGDKNHADLRDEILSEGQPFYEMDTHKLKIGDGKSTYKSLPYVGGGSGTMKVIDIDINNLASGDSVLQVDDSIKMDSLIFVYSLDNRDTFLKCKFTGVQRKVSLSGSTVTALELTNNGEAVTTNIKVRIAVFNAET